MSDRRGRRLWALLTGMLLLGMGSLAGFVWSLGALLSGGPAYVYGPVAAAALVAFVFVALLAMGIVYRVDRLTGRVNRRIRMFE